jgi:hypothetical protein
MTFKNKTLCCNIDGSKWTREARIFDLVIFANLIGYQVVFCRVEGYGPHTADCKCWPV